MATKRVFVVRRLVRVSPDVYAQLVALVERERELNPHVPVSLRSVADAAIAEYVERRGGPGKRKAS